MQEKNDDFIETAKSFLKMVDEKTEEFCQNKKGIAETTPMIDAKVEVISSINKFLKILQGKN